MDTTSWALLLASVAAALTVAALMALLATRRRLAPLLLASPAALLLTVAWWVDGRAAALPETGGAGPAVEVVARQYSWRVRYPEAEIETDGELVLPAGRTTRLSLTTLDLVHSLWLPELGVKLTTIPGRVARAAVTPPEAGPVRLLCAEFCGPRHAAMKGRALVVAPAEFDAWIAEMQRRRAAPGAR